MINRRVVRPSRAVEQLQQLCLNNSAGIDCTRPHSDVKSVYGSKNLVVNTDGSVSLRKPLVLRTKFDSNITRVIPLPNDAFIAVGTFNNAEGFLILNSDLKSVRFRIVWHDVYDNERVNEVPADIHIPSTSLSITNCYATNTASGVVLSNCMLSRTVTNFPGTCKDSVGEVYNPIFDVSLYDNAAGTSPRLVNVFYDSRLLLWCVNVHIPVPTNYTVTDKGEAISRDALLDNPFAVRDSYNVAVPSVKTIRAYAYTSKQAEGIVLNDEYSSVTVNTRHDVTCNFNDSNTFFAPNLSSDYVRAYEVVLSNSENPKKFTSNGLVYELSYSFDFEHRIEVQTDPIGYKVSVYERGYDDSKNWIKLRVYADETSAVDMFEQPDFKITIPASTLHLRFTLNKWYGEGAGYYVPFTPKYDFVIPVTLPSFDTSETITYTQSCNVAKPLVDLLNSEYPSLVESLYSYMSENAAYEVYLNVQSAVSFVTSYTAGEVAAPLDDVTVANLTESVKDVRYRAMDLVDFDKLKLVVLKAFINIPSVQFDTAYCSWRYTLDGVLWEDALSDSTDAVTVTEPKQDPLDNIEAPESEVSDTFNYKKLLSTGTYSNSNLIKERADCLILERRTDAPDGKFWDAVAFKFKLVALDEESHVKANYGEALFYKAVGATTSFEDSDIGNAASGKQLYSKSRLYSFGSPSLKNNILYSYAGEFETPLANIVSLAASSDNEVTAIVRWRDFLIGATAHALYLSEQREDVFYTKILNTAIGIPKNDSGCCVPILNGVIFKSGNKVYQLYPNVYSDDGTVLNVTDISQNISHYLDQYSDSQTAFAFSTETEYILMLSGQLRTHCLRYNYTTRVWSYHEYPVQIQFAKVLDLNDIRLFGTSSEDGSVCEFLFDTTLDTLKFSADVMPVEFPYGDVITRSATSEEGSYGTGIECTISELEEYLQDSGEQRVTPIDFELDTGQKTDAILTTKQFVESKLVFSTLNVNDAFPMNLVIHVDGDPHLVTRDISTDASFWKDGATGGVLNTTFGGLSSTSDSFNTLRQLVVRYSGKGKSVRHILTGNSLCNFKLYETYIRYKLLNVKQ